MQRVASISMTMLLAVELSAAATDTAGAKHGNHGHHRFRGHGVVYSLPAADHADALARTPSFAPTAEAPAAAIPHSEWCAQLYRSYDPATDTFARTIRSAE